MTEGDDAEVDAGALSDAEVSRLLALTERAIVEDTLSASNAAELFDLLETAGVDLEADDLDVDDLEVRLTDAINIARLLVVIWANAAVEVKRSGLRTGTRMLDTVFTAGSTKEFVDETTDIARDELDRLGLDGPLADEPAGDGSATRAGESPDVEALRRRGERLIDRSADVDHEEPVHPAYDRIVDELAADEVRILRLLAEDGPQPVVDVADRGFVPLGSEAVATALSMLCTDAGCRYGERRDAYVTNLHRLGLVWLSDDPVEDRKQYQVLEAQPQVASAMETARRPTLTRRSLHLTPLGTDFCETVLSIDVEAEHSSVGRFETDEDHAGSAG